MAIGLKIVWTLKIAPRHQSTVRGLTQVEQWRGLVENNLVWGMYYTRYFWSTDMLPHHQSTVHKNFSPIGSWHLINQCHIIGPCHIIDPSMWTVSWTVTYAVPYMWSMSIFHLMLLLRFLTILSSKVMSVLSSDLLFIVKWL